jgi:hypothetical protein
MVSLLTALLPRAMDIIDQVIPDKDAAQKAKVAMEKTLIEATVATNLAQIETNKVEAQHRSIFVAGWRPMIGWACAIGITWMAIGEPLANYMMALGGYDTSLLPKMPHDILVELTFALLGMSSLRTFEKLKGVSK